MYSTMNKLPYFSTGIGILVPVLLPVVQFGIVHRLWVPYDKAVINRQTCKCTCWDALFKGTYERYPGGYHHMYFNITSNTLKMWAVTVVAIVLAYETSRHVTSMVTRGCARFDMLVLVFSAIYPHYFSWWVIFNYLNDDFYDQWWHQMVFTGTEMLSTIFVILCMDKDRKENPRLYLAISMIASFHILASGIDQFVDHVLLGSGKNYQQSRDIGLMSGDLLNLILPLMRIVVLHKTNHLPLQKQDSSLRLTDLCKDVLWGGCIVLLLLILVHFL